MAIEKFEDMCWQSRRHVLAVSLMSCFVKRDSLMYEIVCRHGNTWELNIDGMKDSTAFSFVRLGH